MPAVAQSHLPTERAVVGAVVLWGARALDRVAALRPDDLTGRALSEILAAARDLAARGVDIDPPSLDLELRERHPRLVDITFLAGLVDAAAPVGSLRARVTELRRLATLRRIRAAALEVAERSQEPDADPDDLRRLASQVAEADVGERGPRRAREGLVELFEQWSRPAPRLSWGLTDLDDVIGGMRPGNVYLAGGRPGSGKTSFVLGVCRHLAVPRVLQRELGEQNVRPVLLFELEMPETEVLEGLLAQEAKVDARRLSERNLVGDEGVQIQQAAERIAASRLSIDCEAYAMPQIEARAAAWRRENPDGLGLVVLDYVQLCKAAEAQSSRGYERRDLEVAEISRGLKRMAKQLDLPVLAVAALNRAAEARQGHRPSVSDLRECGALEYDASAILLVHREELYLLDNSPQTRQRLAEVGGTAEIIVAKNRHGATGSVRTAFIKNQRRFAPLARGK